MIILGINYNHACASVAFVIDGKVVFAVAEERLNRIKYYGGFPKLSILAGLKYLNIEFKEINYVAVGRNPKANKLKKYAYVFNNPLLIKNFLKLKSKGGVSSGDTFYESLEKECGIPRSECRFELVNVEHHMAHIASSFFTSDWEESAGISIDGSGDFVTCMFAHCKNDTITPVHRVYVPNSLGSFYFTGCQFLGFPHYGDEGKVMGLAPYGNNQFEAVFNSMIDYKEGQLKLNSKFYKPFGSNQGVQMQSDGTFKSSTHFTEEFEKNFGAPRCPDGVYEQRHKNFAFGLQKRFEEIYCKLFNHLYEKVPNSKVVIAGGCALNSVANGKLFDNTPFKETHIHSAPADDGLAIGAALYVSNSRLKEKRRNKSFECYFGHDFKNSLVKDALVKKELLFQEFKDKKELYLHVARLLEKGMVVGCFQGRSEWGPRALGNRSILAHPGFPNMKEILNARIKKRESFRPFAPTVLIERVNDVFKHDHKTPFMLHVYSIKEKWRDKLTAVNHKDNTGRVQTLTEEQNPFYYNLVKQFDLLTGIPVLLNTSFNENEPVVETPEHAIDCFLRTKMDVLVIGDYVCSK